MKSSLRVSALFLSFLAFIPLVSAVTISEVSCTTDAVYWQNTCDQCFLREPAAVNGDVIWFLSDLWENKWDVDQILFKEEQQMPRMFPLNGASWKELKVSDSLDFWVYPSDLETVYSSDDEGYILKPGKSIKWIETTLGSWYELSNNTSAQGTNIGLLVYEVWVHYMPGGIAQIDTTKHRECVLVKSGAPGTTPPPVTPPVTPPELPQTGPEHVLLVLIALLLGSWIFFMTRKKA